MFLCVRAKFHLIFANAKRYKKKESHMKLKSVEIFHRHEIHITSCQFISSY